MKNRTRFIPSMVYVGENHDDHTVRWNTFLVGKNLSEILVDDPLTGNYISLHEWRNKNKPDN